MGTRELLVTVGGVVVAAVLIQVSPSGRAVAQMRLTPVGEVLAEVAAEMRANPTAAEVGA